MSVRSRLLHESVGYETDAGYTKQNNERKPVIVPSKKVLATWRQLDNNLLRLCEMPFTLHVIYYE